jgi:putative addiction module component (TIGR02574 family)
MLADIENLSVSERIQLVEDIWDTIAMTPVELPVTQSQREELDRRMQAYQQHPQEGVSWPEVQAKIKRL